MAYVRKTETLVTEMRDKVRAMKNQAVKAYESSSVDSTSSIYPSMRRAVETSAWKEAPDLKDKMPDSWCAHVDNVYAQFFDGDGRRYFTTSLQTVETTRIKVPATKNGSYYRFEVKITDADCDDTLRAWLSDERKRKEARDTVEQQYNTIEQQLMAFMAGQASLNSAVKDMPEIELYVPETYMRKLREPNERREKKDVQPSLVEEIGIDRDAFAAAAIAHRIATAAQ
jgi:hypothetical protein